jgi:hypothetical protein
MGCLWWPKGRSKKFPAGRVSRSDTRDCLRQCRSDNEGRKEVKWWKMFDLVCFVPTRKFRRNSQRHVGGGQKVDRAGGVVAVGGGA